ncbi:MAG TPA: PRC-barrel domain-containing protein [Candidatus Binatia bacterium]
MQRRTTHLKGYAIAAKDGEIGAVDEFLFDAEDWTVRYVVADTGKWLSGRRVLISPVALKRVNSESKTIEVSLTRDQVENSPDFDGHGFSREGQTAYHDYFGWPYYWVGEAVWAPGVLPGRAPAQSVNANAQQIDTRPEDQPGNEPHVHGVNEVIGHNIEAKDGGIGHVDDFIIDDETWEIRYLIVDTGNWWPGKKVLIAPEWIETVNWIDSKVHIDLSSDAIKSSPEFDPRTLTREYEERLHQHYNRRGYWSP